MLRKTRPFIPLIPLLFSSLLGGCNQAPANTPAIAVSIDTPKLRILRPHHLQHQDGTPHSKQPQSEELTLIESYAAAVGMEPDYIYVDGYDQLVQHLLAGDGDIIVDNLTVTASRKKQLHFTSPITYTREQIIARKGEAPKDAHDLGGRQVAVHASDAYYETLQALQKKRYQPAFEIQLIDESIPTESILIGVAEGIYDLAVADSNLIDTITAYPDNLEVAFDLGSVRAIAWGVRPDNPELLSQLNDFLGQHHLASEEALIASGDLDAIKKRGVLRVLTRNNATTYFLWRGELLGFEYELAKHFADQLGLRLEMVIPPSRDMLVPWLMQGRGDIIAASLAITDARREEGVEFSRPYNRVSEILVSRSNDEGLERPEAMAGRTVVVRRSSSYWNSLNKLRAQGISLIQSEAPEEMETEEIIAKVASGEYDLTVADSHILDIELTWRDDVKAAFPLDEPQNHGWVVRKNNPQLLQAVNAFLKKEYRGLFYNVTYEKYFKNPKRIINPAQPTDLQNSTNLSPYDELVKKYAKEYGLDWRLLVSQMYQESRFNPKAKSWMGALGLMQVMPRTANELGLDDLRNPETGLHAGIKYLSWLMRRFEPELAIADRTWFALAAYNAGIGHVRDARRLTRQLGLDANQWFGNVEKAMLLLAKKEYASKARHGYVRGYQPVNYVREIHDRYLAYINLTQEMLAQEE